MLEGRFLAFFPGKDPERLPLCYVKLLDIATVEDAFNFVKSDFLIEYYILEGTRSCRLK